MVCPILLVCPVCPAPSVSDVGVLWPNGWMDQDETWHGGRPRPRPHCVRWRPSSPPQKKGGTVPQFSAHVRCGQMAGWIKMPLGTEVGLCPGDFVLDRDSAPSPPPKKVHSPPFSAHVYCGQTMPLGTKVGVGPCYIVRRDPAPPGRDTATPSFWPISIVATVAHLSYC